MKTDISMPPGWGWGEEYGEGYMSLTCSPFVDAEDPNREFPGGIGLQFPHRDTPTELAQDLVAAITISAFHEALEFVKVDGRRVGAPHTETEEEWDWMVAHIVEWFRSTARSFHRTLM